MAGKSSFEPSNFSGFIPKLPSHMSVQSSPVHPTVPNGFLSSLINASIHLALFFPYWPTTLHFSFQHSPALLWSSQPTYVYSPLKSSWIIPSAASILSVLCLTCPRTLQKRVPHILRSGASLFNSQHPLISLRQSSTCSLLLPRLPVTTILLYIIPPVTRFSEGSSYAKSDQSR